jgi:Reductase C-terminal
MTKQTFIIVGASLAGAKAAEELRMQGFDGRLLLLGSEAERPYATSWDEVVFRGDREAGEFIAFWLHDHHVVAGMNVNVWDVNEQVQELIRSRVEIDKDALCDLDTPLETLSPGHAGRR